MRKGDAAADVVSDFLAGATRGLLRAAFRKGIKAVLRFARRRGL